MRVSPSTSFHGHSRIRCGGVRRPLFISVLGCHRHRMVGHQPSFDDRSNRGNTCGALAEETLDVLSEVQAQEEGMRARRSITHREFSVRTAGWFTVLKPDGWFPAFRLPARYVDRVSQSGDRTAADHANSHPQANSPRIMMPTTEDRRVMRPLLIVLTAMIVTSGLLWWIMHP